MIDQSVTKWQYRFGLIGKRLDYSFSPDYFLEIFNRAGLLETHSYKAWPLPNEDAVRKFLEQRDFAGCNVTIPYKMLAASQCDVLVGFAAEIGAVNTIKNIDGRLIGYNTDVYGVLQSLAKGYATGMKDGQSRINSPDKKVLILGTGGASRAVKAACDFLNWPVTFVSRRLQKNAETYATIKSKFHLSAFDLIVNTTPLGMGEDLGSMPDLELSQLNTNHLVFDVIYTPKKTLLLNRSEAAGARIMNGELMLHEQANLAWRIWNNT